MTHTRFQLYNITGAVLWVVLLTTAGYFFGNIPLVRDHLTEIVMVGVGFGRLAGRRRRGTRRAGGGGRTDGASRARAHAAHTSDRGFRRRRNERIGCGGGGRDDAAAGNQGEQGWHGTHEFPE